MDTCTSQIINGTVAVSPGESEMTGGITTITHLEDLVSSLTNANPNPKPNPSTQYLNFVRALTATSDESCINHFVKNLNGLGLLAEWAHTAQIQTDDADITADGSMTFLKLLERVVPVIETDMNGYEGIVNILSKFSCSENPRIKETASVLHDKWKIVKNKPVNEESSNPNPNLVEETMISEKEEEEEEDNGSDPISPNDSPVPSPNDSPVPSPNDSPVRVPVEDKDKTRSKSYEHDDDDMDALEIARQVAIQVEEEVVQYRETLCSSPEQEEDETQPSNLLLTESKSTKSTEDKHSDSGLTVGTHDADRVNIDLVNADSVNPVKESKPEECCVGGLDLNENLCTDLDANEAEPGPIHVAASKGVPPVSSPVPGFETGTGMRWKGTAAATSAFHRTGSGTGTGSGAKRDSSFLGFDLNVAEGDEGVGRDSSIEVSSERAKKLRLDLNRTDEDEIMVPVQVPADQRLFWDHCRSSGSSSLSYKMGDNLGRDFDLNDDLACRTGQDQDRGFIQILGSKLAVNNNNNNNNNNNVVAVQPVTLHSFLGPTPSGYQAYQPYQSQMIPPATAGFMYQHNMVPDYWYAKPSTSYAIPVPSPFTRQMVGPVPVPVSVPENGLSVGLSLMPAGGLGLGFGSSNNPFRPGLDLNAGGTGSLEASSSAVPVPGTGLRWRDPDCDRESGFSFGFKQLI